MQHMERLDAIMQWPTIVVQKINGMGLDQS